MSRLCSPSRNASVVVITRYASVVTLLPVLPAVAMSLHMLRQQQVQQVTKLDAEGACPFVGESLRILRKEVGNDAAVLGFVGAPFTLATYIVEGGSSKNFAHIKKMAFASPDILHALLDKLADNVADYVRYQVRPEI